VPAIGSILKKIQNSHSLYWQILFVTLAFTLMVVSAGIFVNHMLENYLKREAENRLAQTEISIMNELRELETMMIAVSKNIHDIIAAGGGIDDLRGYYDEMASELLKKEQGFVFDTLQGHFEALGNVYISAPEWDVPDNYDPTVRPWYKAAVEADGRIATTSVYISLRTDEFLVNCSRRIFNDSGVPLGVVAMSVKFGNITKFVSEMSVVEGGYGLLADENYTVVVHPAADAIGKHMNEVASGPAIFVKLMESGEDSARIEDYNYWGVYSIFYFKRMDNGWVLWLMTPKNIYYRDLTILILFLSVLGIVLLVVVNSILVRIYNSRNKAQDAIAQMQKDIEEKNTLANLGNILNGLDTMIYVSDPGTNEILFINDNMKRHYGMKGDIVGQICYKILQQGLDEKCDFCPCFRLDTEPDSSVVWEEYSTLTNRVYRNADRYIDWPNGKTVHLQHSIDITDLRTMTDALHEHLERQSVMTQISQSFLSTEDLDALITEALRMVGEFMGIDQILMYITEDNENSYTCKHEWVNPELELPTRVGKILTLTKDFQDLVLKVKEQQSFYVSSNDPDTRKVLTPYREYFHNNYFMTFVFLGEELLATIDFARKGDEKLWTEDEINMATYVTNVLFGVLRKHSAELQLITAKESAEQSNRAKGVFLAHMSHEIRTPMNAILGISEIQLQSKKLPPDTEEAFKGIYDSGNLLLNIINDILDFSKIEAGKMEIIPVKYNIPSMLNDTVQLNLLRYESKPLEFKLDLDANTPLELYGDELRIKQILNNLLSNAFKYTDKGEINLTVCAEQGKDEETTILIFRISDTGQGMSEDQIARLFDEYSRFNMETNRTVTGTGLGMNIVKRLIEMMDGEIFVESETGKGTTFTVRLPQKNAGSTVCGAELADNLRNFRFHSTPISNKAQIVREYMPYGSVLIVDDVASNLYVAKGLLAPYGLRIETAVSGTEAIEKIRAGNVYDIVFMDHMMPVMDGMEATKIIRGMGYTHPVIALTANAVIGQSDIFLANGFDGFVSKPIDLRELNSALNRFIRDKQPREIIEATRQEQRKREAENSGSDVPEIKDMSEIGKYFVLDAENAIRVMEESCAKLPDAKAVDAYITAVHGMKNVLANVGEEELSKAALKLERAGKDGDLAVITEETPEFINALLVLIDKYKPVINHNTVEITDSDTAYLREKLLKIKEACQAFDVTTAEEALNDLRQKAWPRNVNETLDEISVHLLHGTFRKAAAVAEEAGKA
jgi:signal transduction histidine kinase/DNA-binding NarL/FixJ family response regulator